MVTLADGTKMTVEEYTLKVIKDSGVDKKEKRDDKTDDEVADTLDKMADLLEKLEDYLKEQETKKSKFEDDLDGIEDELAEISDTVQKLERKLDKLDKPSAKKLLQNLDGIKFTGSINIDGHEYTPDDIKLVNNWVNGNHHIAFDGHSLNVDGTHITKEDLN